MKTVFIDVLHLFSLFVFGFEEPADLNLSSYCEVPQPSGALNNRNIFASAQVLLGD